MHILFLKNITSGKGKRTGGGSGENVCQFFLMIENLRNLILYIENIPIDFHGERVLEQIFTDLLEMSMNVSVGINSKTVSILLSKVDYVLP